MATMSAGRARSGGPSAGRASVEVLVALHAAMEEVERAFPAVGLRRPPPAENVEEILADAGNLPPEVRETARRWVVQRARFDAAVSDLEELDHRHLVHPPEDLVLLGKRVQAVREGRVVLESLCGEVEDAVSAQLDRAAGKDSGEKISPGPEPDAEAHADYPGPAPGQRSASGSAGPVWTVEVVFTPSGDRVRADALLQGVGVGGHGWGRAWRSPGDPDVPLIGQELAAARALSDLAHQLLHGAAEKIEAFEAHSVRLHL